MTQDAYVKLYVNKKSLLFPLMQKYSGTDPSKLNHGQAASIYIQLLRNSIPFRTEVDSSIEKLGYHNAAGDTVDQAAQTTKSSGLFSGGFLGGLLNLFGGIAQSNAEQEKQDTALYSAVLAGQGGSDTTKLLVISGIALTFVIVGVVFVVKMK